MALSITPFLREHEAAAVRFNQRMREGKAATDFFLPETAAEVPASAPLQPVHWVAVESDGEIRGGMISVCCPVRVNGERAFALNLQSILSEGLINPRCTMVGAQLVKFALRQNRYAYVVGMGGETRPLPRLLRAYGWSVRAVPFYFRLLRPSRCVRHLVPFRSNLPRRIASTAAAATGAAWLGAQLLHRGSAAALRGAREQQIIENPDWDGWSDQLWERFEKEISFAVLRDARHAALLYQPGRNAARRYRVESRGRAAAWFSLFVTKMRANQYFGDLTVATLADCLGQPEALPAALAQAAVYARRAGADVLITNQQHRVLRQACLEAGFRQAASNYLLATSPALAAAIQDDTVYVTRRDGDGLTHLV